MRRRGARAFESLLDSYRDPALPGIALAVIRHGEPLWAETLGSANLGTGAAIEAATNFRLASISKQFTATGILLLAGRGALDLDASLADLLDGFPAFGARIRVRHLLQHSSGLVDYEDLVAADNSSQVSDREVLALVSASNGTLFEPGTHFRYSNTGYAFLAVLAEELSGQPFARFLEDNIFAPLAMHATVAFERGVSTVADRALGYSIGDDGVAVLSDQDSTSAVLGDGGIYSSLLDYAKWDRALYSDRLLPSAARRAMWTPGLANYGFGWRIDRFDGQRRLHHEGFSCGFQNHVMRFPDVATTVLVLSNRREPPVSPIAEALASIHLANP